MRSNTSTTVHSPPGAIPDRTTDPASSSSLVASGSDLASVQASGAAANGGETRGAHLRRKALRGRLHGYAVGAVGLVAVLIALAASNTGQVKVSWVLGSSHVSLVWLVLVAAILGWVLGLLASARFHWRTRAPHTGAGGRS